MEVRTQSKTGPVVAKLPPIVAGISQQVSQLQQTWLDQLRSDPTRMAQVEREVHGAFRQLADQLMSGLLAEASASSPALQAAKKK